jgi:hypothetical protein
MRFLLHSTKTQKSGQAGNENAQNTTDYAKSYSSPAFELVNACDVPAAVILDLPHTV